MLASKHSNGAVAQSQLVALTPEQRVDEIARMLGGATITANTRASAGEMLKLSRE